MSLIWSSLRAYCLTAARTSSPSSISHACRSPSGVKITWFGRAGELARAGAASRLHLELEPLVGGSVVVVLHDPLGRDLAGLRVHRHDLDGHPLVHDLADLLGAAVGQHDAGVVMEAAEHHADLLADLVREQAQRLRAVEVAGELAHRLAHHPRLQADGLVAHLALELDARRQRGDRVQRHDVDGAGAHEHVADLQRLLAVVGLGDEQLVDVDADLPRVERVHRVLGVDEGADPAELLGLGEDVVDERRLARGLRAEDLDDPPARHAADAEREVERQRARRDRGALHECALVAHAHDRALAELALDLRQRAREGVVAGLGSLLRVVESHGYEVPFCAWKNSARYGPDRTENRA